MELTLTIPVLCAIPLAPLIGSMLVGFFGTGFLGKQLSRGACQTIAILGVTIALQCVDASNGRFLLQWLGISLDAIGRV